MLYRSKKDADYGVNDPIGGPDKINRKDSGWRGALFIVQPRTVILWQRKRFRDYWRGLSRGDCRGRPAISLELRRLIRCMWQANPTWGSPRIVAELQKLRIDIAKSTVEKYRPKLHKPTSPSWCMSAFAGEYPTSDRRSRRCQQLSDLLAFAPNQAGNSDTGRNMKINGNAIRPGMVIEHQGRLWRTIRIRHTQPGKGGAYLQVELKDIRDGTKLNERFRSAESVDRIRLEQCPYQYLYTDGTTYTFMDIDAFEQVSLGGDLVGEEQIPFLQENMIVTIEFHEETPLGVQLPDSVVLEVVEADAVVKGQTASSSYKPAVLENGVSVMVPLHIEAGTRIVVNTSDGTYVQRAKD